MKTKLIPTLALATALGLTVSLPAAASAQINPQQMAAQACRAELKQAGKRVFRKRYGVKPMRKCIRKAVREVQGAVTIAASDCNDELEDFGLAEFLLEYGTTDPAAAFDQCTAEGVDFELEGYFQPLTDILVGD